MASPLVRAPHHRRALSVALAGRPASISWLPLLALMGCLDVAALATVTAAGNLPHPEFATVMSSAFDAVTVLVARAFLKEPIAPAQLAGMVLIFGGVAALPTFSQQHHCPSDLRQPRLAYEPMAPAFAPPSGGTAARAAAA